MTDENTLRSSLAEVGDLHRYTRRRPLTRLQDENACELISVTASTYPFCFENWRNRRYPQFW